MIRYALTCEAGHAFDSWFANSSAFDRQAKRALEWAARVRIVIPLLI